MPYPNYKRKCTSCDKTFLNRSCFELHIKKNIAINLKNVPIKNAVSFGMFCAILEIEDRDIYAAKSIASNVKYIIKKAYALFKNTKQN